MEYLSQGKGELEMVEKGFSVVGPSWDLHLDVEKVCGTVYRCAEVWFWLRCEGCLGKREGVREGAGQDSLSARWEIIEL